MTVLPSNLLTRRPHRPDATSGLVIAGDLRLAPGRVHELCGVSRRMLALAIAARTTGPVFWINAEWFNTRPNPCGYAPWLDPGRLIHLGTGRERDLLWAAEEALRSGTVPVVIADLPAPPGLTAVRRLHLAAETGIGAAGVTAPLGLLLTPDGGAQGIETRWRIAPDFDGDGPAWRIERLRARMAPPRACRITAAAMLGHAPLEEARPSPAG